jgi:MFS family permease
MGPHRPSRWGVLVVVSLAVFVLVIDATAIGVSLSTLVVDLNTRLSILQSVITIATLVKAALLLAGARLQDIIGRKRTFFSGMAIYGAGVFIAAISMDAGMFLLGWSVLEGIGTVLMLPATTTFITGAYEGKDRAFAFGVWGAIASVGSIVGLIFGGYLATFYSWRWIFVVEIVILLLIVVLHRVLKETRPTLSWKKFDYGGLFFSAAGLGCLVFGILLVKEPERWGLVFPLIVGGIALLVALYYWERRLLEDSTGDSKAFVTRARKKGLVDWEALVDRDVPVEKEVPVDREVHKGRKVPAMNREMQETREVLLDVTILPDRTFLAGNIVSVGQKFIVAGVIFIFPLFYEVVTGASAYETGIAILPMSVAIIIFSILGTRLASWFEPKYVLLAGIAIIGAGLAALRDIFSLTTTARDVLPGSVLFGIGLGIILSQVTNITLSSIPDERQTDASGIYNTTRQVGSSLGTGIVGVVLVLGYMIGLQSSVPSAIQLDPGLGTIPISDVAVNQAMEWAFLAMIVVVVVMFIAGLFVKKMGRIE